MGQVRFFDFSRFHGKDAQGSTYIRVNQLIKYWPEADHYKYGENPDVLIFQKVYTSPDYQFPHHFKGKKILDICDPDWFDGAPIVDTCNAMDAVVTPTEKLAEFISQFHPNVHVIPDRFDLELVGEPKKQQGIARKVVWFGYSHNSELMRYAIKALDEFGLDLLVISNDDPFLHQWSRRNYKDFYEFRKYREDTIYDDLKEADFAILPDGLRPVDPFKSNNKTIKANLAGLPVAKNLEDIEKYMGGWERQLFQDNELPKIRQEYDVKKSVEQYKELIAKL